MLENYNIRTDLALEQRERFAQDQVEVQGVVLEEEYDEEREILTTIVRIETEKGAKIMGKPTGIYITIEAPNMSVPDEAYHSEVSKLLAAYLTKIRPVHKTGYAALVIGLGNRDVTPDALGPMVVDHMNITRHIIREYGAYAMGEKKSNMISAQSPGVMAQTGMEALEIIKGIVEETRPDFLVVVDALAARNTRRLNRTIQITDAGIYPGSGVGNHRNAITEKTVGIPVLSIGVPTVVDAATIVNDTMENLILAMEENEQLKGAAQIWNEYGIAEKYEFVKERISPHLIGMFVTPKDIDETMKRISLTISEGLNLFFKQES